MYHAVYTLLFQTMYIFDFLYLLLTKTEIFIHSKILLINKVCEECILNGFHKFNCIERKKRNKHECLINIIIVPTSNLYAFKIYFFFQNNAMLKFKIFHYIIHLQEKQFWKRGKAERNLVKLKLILQSRQGCGKEKNSLTKRKSKYFCEYYNEIVIKPSCFLYTNAALNASL